MEEKLKKLQELRGAWKKLKNKKKKEELQAGIDSLESDLLNRVGDHINDLEEDLKKEVTPEGKEEILEKIEELRKREKEIKGEIPEASKIIRITATSKTGGRYRRCGLIFHPGGEKYEVSKETLFVLRNDPWIEVKEEK